VARGASLTVMYWGWAAVVTNELKELTSNRVHAARRRMKSTTRILFERSGWPC
jgi:hypothetical protein